MIPFTKLPSGNQVLDQIQDNISRALAPLLLVALLNGSQLKNITLTDGQDNLVPHKLGRKLQGWLVSRQRSGAVIWDEQDTNTSNELYLHLRTTDSCVVDIFVW